MLNSQKIISWLENKTDSKYISFILWFIAFFESILFPIPVDIFTCTLSSLHPKKWFRFATIATTGSIAGALAGYILGYFLFDSFGVSLINFYGYQDALAQVTHMFHGNVFLIMFISAFTPIPYKVFTLVGGALQVSLFPFVIASLLGRGLRFYGESYLSHRFGKKLAQHILEKINFYSFVFAVLVIFYLYFFSAF